MGVAAAMRDSGWELKLRIWADSSAAKSVGWTRHQDVFDPRRSYARGAFKSVS